MSIAEIVEQNKPDLFSIIEKPKFTLRPYQKEAVDAGVDYLKGKSKRMQYLYFQLVQVNPL